MIVRPDTDELAQPLTVETAHAHIAENALSDAPVGLVGLEVETHLVDLAAVEERVEWRQIQAIMPLLAAAAGRTPVTVEPGGQIEFSGPVAPDVAGAVSLMRDDIQRARLALHAHQLGLAHAGADPLRPPRRVNPNPRYQAMQQHYAATGRTAPGATMMTSSAALQLNLQAGPTQSWAARVAHAHRLAPTLIALSACSPWLAGASTGWRSSRQRAWGQLGSRRSEPFADAADPAQEWARYAMRTPLLFVGTGTAATAVRGEVTFADWVRGTAQLTDRKPTVADLDLHLSTLFPPVRLRGYLELRYLDMSPPRWWPAVAAVVAILMDDPGAVDAAAEATEPATALWTEAAQVGLGNLVLAESARRCMAIAVDHAPAALASAVADLAALVDSGRCPGDLFADRIAEVGPQAAFQELAYA